MTTTFADQLKPLRERAISDGYNAPGMDDLLREAADKLRKIHGALPSNDAKEWNTLIETADRIQQRLDTGGWIPVSGKDGAMRNATFIDSKLLGCHIATERNGQWYARPPLPALPKEK